MVLPRQVKVQAEEAAKMAADSKMIVETESSPLLLSCLSCPGLKSMEQALEDKSTEISKAKSFQKRIKTSKFRERSRKSSRP